MERGVAKFDKRKPWWRSQGGGVQKKMRERCGCPSIIDTKKFKDIHHLRVHIHVLDLGTKSGHLHVVISVVFGLKASGRSLQHCHWSLIM